MQTVPRNPELTSTRRCPPAISILLPLEGRPIVAVDAINEAEAERLAEWLQSKPDYAQVVNAALALSAASVV
jgi:hypothetical protein